MTPVWINNRNNLNRGFKSLVEWLRSAGVEPLILDNASTYPPLLEFYKDLKVTYTSNLGPYAFWELGLHHQQAGRFIVTDPDVVPSDDCPKDLIERLSEALDAGYAKAGPSLRIDNLPPHYAQAVKVMEWERQFWDHPVELGYEASIDTTFAMYEPGSEAWAQQPHLRLKEPYVFEHIPWYESSHEINPERDFYRAHARKDWTHW